MRSLLLALVIAGAAPLGAQPASPPTVSRLQVALWPEYDRSQMLVMLRGELAPDTPLPATIPLPMPAGVTSPHAVAWSDGSGGLKVAEYTVEPGDAATVVRTTLPGRSFRLEYYADLETHAGDPLRTYTFEWPAGLAVTSLGYEVQVPTEARDMMVTPSPADSGLGADGLTYFHGEIGSVAADGSARIEVAYRKNSDRLSETVVATPSPGTTGSSPASSAPGGGIPVSVSPPRQTEWWPIYVAVALLVGVFIGMGLQRMGR